MARSAGMTADSAPTVSPPRLRTIAAVINPASGGVGPGAAEEVAVLVAEYGVSLTLAAPEPSGLEAAVRAAVESAPDLVLVLAGDGTARTAAELAGPDGPLVAPLAGGTLNLLPHALYGTEPWREVLPRLLQTGVERPAPGGRVGERAFYVAAILGAPALWAPAREAVRAGRPLEALRRASLALRRAFTGRIRYSLDGGPAKAAEALVLISPAISRKLEGTMALEAAALDLHSAHEAFRLAVNGLIGDWRRDPGVTARPCQRGQVSARHAIPAILDGEIERLGRSVSFEFLPRAFRALVPPDAEAPPS
jgi:diacylglycerol kinase family enzyme